MHPNLKVPYTHQWSAGWQREFGRTMALEVRYVGNINSGEWTTWNLNHYVNRNILENGFYDEFRRAQQNLMANVAAGRGATFAFTGEPGTSPLPIFLAFFNGIPLNDSRNQNSANYTHANFRSSAWYNSLRMYAPAMDTIRAPARAGSSSRGSGQTPRRRASAELLHPEPDRCPEQCQHPDERREPQEPHASAGAAPPIQRRVPRPGQLQPHSVEAAVDGGHCVKTGCTWIRSAARERSFKVNWVYELPFGQGRTFGSGASRFADAADWRLGVERPDPTPERNAVQLRNFRLVGMTEKEFQKMFKFYKETDSAGKTRVYMFPKDVIENSILALYTASATTTTGYSGALPTGRYLAPASGPDCVQYSPATARAPPFVVLSRDRCTSRPTSRS
jgi:hypothetical protein